ncbi:holin family protein [Maritimibacter sp. UBA3975]|uniref:holin family protein n=1 Tax=Maritimibacter sp. UBA3975 TaxID=1946833 RepID=UPI000C0AA6E9|nr:holin family protein [Maritimibacter sp. UBA3975]MAM61212.1 carboxylesterase [Maritimibacter sp.]|tara:strand:- start:15102 stop:15632 length:531 start_codon:yes stop_codon:yes gene_type:complete
MGLIDGAMNLVFGSGRNVVRETAGVFWENAEAQAVREAARHSAALDQFAHEFALPGKGWFDRFIDGINRVPRPALALGTIGLFVSAMVDPVWFAARMNGIALVPEPLWWLMGAIVSFYFGARHQVKAQEFRRSVAATIASTESVVHNLGVLDSLEAGSRAQGDPNPALEDWSRDGK